MNEIVLEKQCTKLIAECGLNIFSQIKTTLNLRKWKEHSYTAIVKIRENLQISTRRLTQVRLYVFNDFNTFLNSEDSSSSGLSSDNDIAGERATAPNY